MMVQGRAALRAWNIALLSSQSGRLSDRGGNASKLPPARFVGTGVYPTST